MKVVISAEAEDDLKALRHWIAEDNPARAATFLDELEEKIAGLANWPLRFRMAFQSSSGPVRRLVHRRYRILYAVSAETVEILHVHHGSRDAPPFD